MENVLELIKQGKLSIETESLKEMNIMKSLLKDADNIVYMDNGVVTTNPYSYDNLEYFQDVDLKEEIDNLLKTESVLELFKSGLVSVKINSQEDFKVLQNYLNPNSLILSFDGTLTEYSYIVFEGILGPDIFNRGLKTVSFDEVNRAIALLTVFQD